MEIGEKEEYDGGSPHVNDTELTTLTEPKLNIPEDTKEQKTRKRGYPKHIFFIIVTEFCERFSFYGMRTVLILYVRNYLLFDDDASTAIYHAFAVLAYLTPLFGGILADSYLGKFKAIAYLSVVYVFGHVFKTIGAIPYIPSPRAHMRYRIGQLLLLFSSLSMIGLLLIAIGMGGIKPCVSSFGGDQFSDGQDKYRSQFFSLFYFSINLGALMSKWITPIFRADLDCYPGEEGPQFQECFSVAFGVPGLLMLVALVLFLVGTRFYTMVKPEGSIFWKFCLCVWSACKNWWKYRNKPKTVDSKRHWIYYADAPNKMKRDTIAVLRVLFLFLPLPFFWALFDQQGSRWTLQALQLNGYWGDYLVKPDQIDVINPLLIVTLIPLFEVTLYPLLRHFKINFSPLKKMTVGLLLAGISFVCAAVLQFEIDKRLTVLPSQTEYSVRIISMLPCDIQLMSNMDHFDGLRLMPNGIIDKKSELFRLEKDLNISYVTCDHSFVERKILKKGGHVTDVILIEVQDIQLFMQKKKLENGNAVVSFINVNLPGNISAHGKDLYVGVRAGERSKYQAIKRGTTNYAVSWTAANSTTTFSQNGSVETEAGGAYTVLVAADLAPKGIRVVQLNNETSQLLDVNPNTINIAWMIPQFFIITVGEVFLSITGLEFSYTQAPSSMKSVLTSFWFLTVSMGSVIVLLVAKTMAIPRQAHEFLLFAGLIGVATIIFAIMAKRYKVTNSNDDFKRSRDDSGDKEPTLPEITHEQ